MASWRELLQQGRLALQPVSSSAALDAQVLLCHQLEIDSATLFTWPERQATSEQEQGYRALIDRRTAGEPVAYLTGWREFYGLRFCVTSATLIPRPETELLVELALESLPAGDALKVADLGCGSGAIAISLARLRPAWHWVAVDRSAEALEVARKNARQLNANNMVFTQDDWLSNWQGKLDAIICNPPYIAEDDEHLRRGDVRFEPVSALVAGDAGLADITRVSQQAADKLVAGGWLAFEHGREQGPAVRAQLQQTGFTNIRTHQDMAGLDRVTEGFKSC